MSPLNLTVTEPRLTIVVVIPDLHLFVLLREMRQGLEMMLCYLNSE